MQLTRALGLREVPGQDPLETLLVQLSKRDLLLVLDNCEHLIDACAAVVGALARSCPGARGPRRRERLGVPGEAVVVVGGLELPAVAGARDQGAVERSEAGTPFIDGARLARADFVVDDPDAVADICQRLDGTPLALELAAARARLMSLGAIAEGLSDRFHLLVGSDSGARRANKTLSAWIQREASWLHRTTSGACCTAFRCSPPASRSPPQRPLLRLSEVEQGEVLGSAHFFGRQVACPGLGRYRPVPASRDDAGLWRRGSGGGRPA